MAVAPVQTRNFNGNSQTSASLAYTSNVAAGSTLSLIFTYYNDPDLTITVASSLGPSLTLKVGPERSGIDDATKWIFNLDNAGAGATTLTVTITGSSGAHPYTIEIQEWSGTNTAGSFVAGSQGQNSTPTVDPGNITNTVPDAVLICASTSYFSQPTVGSGFTAIDPGNANWFEFTQYKVISSAGSQSVAMGGSVDGWVAVAACFQGPGGGGGGGSPGPQLMLMGVGS